MKIFINSERLRPFTPVSDRNARKNLRHSDSKKNLSFRGYAQKGGAAVIRRHAPELFTRPLWCYCHQSQIKIPALVVGIGC